MGTSSLDLAGTMSACGLASPPSPAMTGATRMLRPSSSMLRCATPRLAMSSFVTMGWMNDGTSASVSWPRMAASSRKSPMSRMTLERISSPGCVLSRYSLTLFTNSSTGSKKGRTVWSCTIFSSNSPVTILCFIFFSGLRHMSDDQSWTNSILCSGVHHTLNISMSVSVFFSFVQLPATSKWYERQSILRAQGSRRLKYSAMRWCMATCCPGVQMNLS
mmetsp:Transcript_3588/g.10299  ORF Transcript_3588/g.10299 Transcript_3588/m.10299 type:complete len:218 (-) Transcript_3588:1396-2049(-)